MSLWSHVSQICWEEAEAPAAPRARGAATGVPASLRGAVRFVVVGFSAIVLTAQVTGIRLTARVDADPTYCVVESQKCKQGCKADAACIQRCNLRREQCRHEDHGDEGFPEP